MNNVDQELLLDIFREENLEGVKFHQDGVVLKGNAQDDKRNFVGSLMILQRSAWDPTRVPGGRVHYLVWIPYSYLFCLAPHLVSPAIRRLIDTNGDLPLLDRRDASAHIATKVEWMYTMCLPLTRVAKLQRKSNLRGKRIVTIYRAGGAMECPLIFQDGGMSRFFDDLKRVCVVRQVPNSVDEFLIEDRGNADEDDVVDDTRVPLVQKVGEYVDPLELRKELYAAPSSPSSSSHLPLSPPSGSHSAKQRSSVMNSLLSFGANLTQRGTKIAGSVMQSVADISSNSKDDSLSATGDSSGFDVVEPVTNVEDMVPNITHLLQRKSMKPKLSKGEWDMSLGGNRDRRIDPPVFARLREKAFYGGVDDAVRADVWSYLLQLYPVGSTLAERDRIDAELKREYETIKLQWVSITPEQEKRFSAYRERKSAIDKDVIRTDRFLSEFADDDSQKLRQLHDVLMTYAMFNFDLGYCQGMSDIVAIFALLYDEEWKMWAMFRQMMSLKCEGNFRSDVKSNMEKQLQSVELLVQRFAPALHHHLHKHHAHGMTFCFRWLLILFKREFDIPQTMKLWDVLLSCPFTPQYEVFVTAALLRAMSAQIVDQALTYDELLKFANRLAGNASVTDVILLALEFYETVAQQLDWKQRLGSSQPKQAGVLASAGLGAQASSPFPTLDEVLSSLRDPDELPIASSKLKR